MNAPRVRSVVQHGPLKGGGGRAGRILGEYRCFSERETIRCRIRSSAPHLSQSNTTLDGLQCSEGVAVIIVTVMVQMSGSLRSRR